MSNTLARTPYSRLDIGRTDGQGTDKGIAAQAEAVNVELRKLFSQQLGMFVPRVIVSAISPYSVKATDWTLLADASAGPVNLVFPDAARFDGMNVRVVKTDATANQVTLVATISGVLNPILGAQYAELTIDAGNGAWYAQGAAGSGGLIASKYRITTDGLFRVTTTGAFRITTAGA